MTRMKALVIGLLFLGISLAGCLEANDKGIEEDPEQEVELSEWDTYYVESDADLPNCNSDTLGRLYYVASTTSFEVCLESGWSFIDISGADGVDGVPGLEGPMGEKGPRGDDGEDVDAVYIAQLEFELANVSALNAQLQSNISSMEEELDVVDNVIQMYYMNFVQLQNQINTINSNLSNSTTCQLGPWANCQGANLTGMNLSGMDLSGIDLRNSKLDGADLSNATFHYADFSGSTFLATDMNNSSFNHAVMKGVLIRQSYANQASFLYADLTGADLSNSYFIEGQFVGTDLIGAQLFGTNIHNSSLSHTDLSGASMYGTNATGVSFYYTDLSDAWIGYTFFGENVWVNVICPDGILYSGGCST